MIETASKSDLERFLDDSINKLGCDGQKLLCIPQNFDEIAGQMTKQDLLCDDANSWSKIIFRSLFDDNLKILDRGRYGNVAEEFIEETKLSRGIAQIVMNDKNLEALTKRENEIKKKSTNSCNVEKCNENLASVFITAMPVDDPINSLTDDGNDNSTPRGSRAPSTKTNCNTINTRKKVALYQYRINEQGEARIRQLISSDNNAKFPSYGLSENQRAKLNSINASLSLIDPGYEINGILFPKITNDSAPAKSNEPWHQSYSSFPLPDELTPARFLSGADLNIQVLSTATTDELAKLSQLLREIEPEVHEYAARKSSTSERSKITQALDNISVFNFSKRQYSE